MEQARNLTQPFIVDKNLGSALDIDNAQLTKIKVNDIRRTIVYRHLFNGENLKDIAEDYNLYPTTLSNDKTRNADKWAAEYHRIHENEFTEVPFFWRRYCNVKNDSFEHRRR